MYKKTYERRPGTRILYVLSILVYVFGFIMPAGDAAAGGFILVLSLASLTFISGLWGMHNDFSFILVVMLLL